MCFHYEIGNARLNQTFSCCMMTGSKDSFIMEQILGVHLDKI